MGGRGSAGRQGGGGFGGADINVKSSQSLISLRNEGKRVESDQVLTVLREVEQNYGVTVGDATVDKVTGRGARSVLAYMYRGSGDLGFNQRFFDEAKMTQAYDRSVDMKFHPPRGKKSAMEAVAAHEMGHRLNYVAAESVGRDMDAVAKDIVTAAAQRYFKSYAAGKSEKQLQSRISGYAKESHAETISEAYADVYCNGGKASRASREIVRELNYYLQAGPRRK